eukprot:573833-Pyramimonas_sp.AAC.1
MWRLPCGHIFHAQRWDRITRVRVERQMDGAPSEAQCVICRGAGPIAAEFHYALAGGHNEADRHEEVLRGA